MSLVIELPASLEAELRAESERLGVSISEVVVKRISNRHYSDQFEKPKNGKELVQNWRKHGSQEVEPTLPIRMSMRDHYEPNPKLAFVTDMKLIDTDVLIDVQRGVIPALAWFESLPDLPITSSTNSTSPTASASSIP